MDRSRAIGTLLALGVVVTTFASTAATEAADQPVNVEIIALSHWPVQDALKPVRAFLGSLGSRVKVTELDAESPEGEKRLAALGLKGHIPMLLLVDGSDHYKRADGQAVEFKDFPAKESNPLGLNGTWTVDDFKAAVSAALGK